VRISRVSRQKRPASTAALSSPGYGSHPKAADNVPMLQRSSDRNSSTSAVCFVRRPFPGTAEFVTGESLTVDAAAPPKTVEATQPGGLTVMFRM
jgi:hypothetical protein